MLEVMLCGDPPAFDGVGVSNCPSRSLKDVAPSGGVSWWSVSLLVADE
jgi:hypothetical protein